MRFSWKELSPKSFEELCFHLLDVLEFTNIKWYGRTGKDQGRDILAQRLVELAPGVKKATQWIVECKRYVARPPAIHDLENHISWAKYHKPDFLLLIVTNVLTAPTKDWLSGIEKGLSFRIVVWEKPDVEKLLLAHEDTLRPFLPLTFFGEIKSTIVPHDLNISLVNQHVDTFESIFDLLESDFKRRQHGVEIIYLIDFSELHGMLYPRVSCSEDLTETGYVKYMFENKLADESYVLPPAAAWEWLRYLEETSRRAYKFSKFQQLLEIPSFKRFCEILQSPTSDPDALSARLRDAYSEMGGLVQILRLVDSDIVQQDIRHSTHLLEDMISKSTILPLDATVEDCRVYSMNREIYDFVLDYLRLTRLDRDANNKVDALNMALAYTLTDNLYKSNQQFYTIVTHSKGPLQVYKEIRWKGDPLGSGILVREPQYVATKLLCFERFANERKRTSFIEKGANLMNAIKTNMMLFEYPREMALLFAKEKRLPPKQTIQSFTEFIEIYEKYYQEIFPFTREVLEVNSKMISSMQREETTRIKKLAEVLSDAETYENRMAKAHDLLEKNLHETRRLLKRFIDDIYRDFLPSD